MTDVIHDGRQSEIALAVARGTTRLLVSLGFAVVSELNLPSGRRADLVAMNRRGDIWIVEIKSSLADYRADQKWHHYRMHCDRFFFAIPPDFAVHHLPEESGLILADAHSADLAREAPAHPLAGPTRKALIIAFGHASAMRFSAMSDPMIQQNLTR